MSSRTQSRKKKAPTQVAIEVKKAKVVAPHQFKSVWDNCVGCNINLKKWGHGGNGFKCPPCVAFDQKQDAERRAHLEKVTSKRLALAVHPDGKMVQVDLFKTSAEKIVGGTTCNLYRKEDAWAGEYPVVFTAYMNDTAHVSSPSLPDNTFASEIVGAMRVFASDEINRCAGTILFTGPNGTTLLRKEIRKYKKIKNGY